MKNKFGLWLNIVTICLCVCAIAIGVYAATTASLTVSGQIGFKAHDVDLTVTGTIEGHGVDDSGADASDGSPSEAVALANAAFTNGVGTMSMGSSTRYFTDMESEDGKPADIIIRLSVTNNSKYAITGKAGTHTLPTNVTATVEPASVKIEMGATQAFVVTLSMTATNDSYENITASANNTQINMSFEKYVANVRNELKLDANNKLYIEMGQDFSGNALKWYAVAKGTSTQEVSAYTSLKSTTYTSVDNVTAGNYIFLSEYILPEASGDNYIAFTPEADWTEDNGYGVEYNGSTIQQYLAGTSTNNIFTTYGISQTEGFYAEYINQVNLAAETCDDYRDSSTYTTQATSNQKLWLLSEAEYIQFFGNGDSSGIGNILGGSADYWWLRSPCGVSDGDAGARYVDYYGRVDDFDVGDGGVCGVRAAFQITIPA